LFPDLTLFRRTASRLLQRKLWPSERTTCDQQKQHVHRGRGGFPSVLIAASLAISKKSTFLTLCKQQQKTVCLALFQPTYPTRVGKQSGSKGPFQTSISCKLQRCDIDSAQDKPANPFFKKSAKAYSIYFNLHMSPPPGPICNRNPTPHRSIQSY
jgi:hypothetical protein